MVFINEIMHMVIKEDEEKQILQASAIINTDTEFDQEDHYGADNESTDSQHMSMISDAAFHEFLAKILRKLIVVDRNPAGKYQEVDPQVGSVQRK
ncbi:unnamed protein product [Adineta steineri]|uniref:Uncharacterized protein n=1 Tax=Adineta steineri TaxID=433720 RepID=A0A815PET5_9BILA|nr:unnamed protein product [Adineta steineri]CAF4273598.1 unnamed protein product [Adineta steineri]